MSKSTSESPYLNDQNRLGDVVAAIQAMGTYKFYKLPFEGWADRISGDTSKADHWKRVFSEHPEFFRFDSKKERASLVWRRQLPKRYQVDKDLKVTREEFDSLSDYEKNRVSRHPLTATDIKSLIDTAINLHSRAVDHQKQKRWWIALASAVGALIGSIVGALLRG